MSDGRTCTKCGETKPATTDFFNLQHAKHNPKALRPTCRPCQLQDAREYRVRKKEPIAVAKARHYAQNRAEITARSRAHYDSEDPAARRARARAWTLKNLYGLTPERFDSMLRDQGGVCALCHRPPPGTRALCVDHNHETGEVRGLLCGRCNSALGTFGDNEDGLLVALAYLRGER